MNPVGDPYTEAAAIEDHRGDPVTVIVDEDALDGDHAPKLLVALRDADGDMEALTVIDDPEAGVWRLEKQ